MSDYFDMEPYNDGNDNCRDGGNGNGGNGLELVMAAIVAAPALIVGINEILQSEMTFPNIPLKVNDGDWMLWDTLVECDGWRLQQNEITKHCRILDPDNIRRAWGTKNGMRKALESLKNRIG